MIAAVLWDNDGMLVDTESLFFEITRLTLAETGAALTPEYWARHYLGEGKSSREIAAALGLAEPELERVLARCNERYRRRLRETIPLRPGVRETLQSLRGRVRLALVTGSSLESLRLMHQHTGLLPFFECLVTSDLYEKSKPHPDAYLAALRRLGLPADRCLAVEDSPRGLAAATAAGLRCVLVPTELTALDLCPPHTCIQADATAVLRLIDGGQWPGA